MWEMDHSRLSVLMIYTSTLFIIIQWLLGDLLTIKLCVLPVCDKFIRTKRNDGKEIEIVWQIDALGKNTNIWTSK